MGLRQEELEQSLLRPVRRFTATLVAASEKQETDASCLAATDFAGTDFIFPMQYYLFITQFIEYVFALVTNSIK